jgi:hypothetical protein
MEVEEDRCWCERKMNENKTHYKCPKCNTIKWKDTSQEGMKADLHKHIPTPYEKLITKTKEVVDENPSKLIGFTIILGVLLVISWVWICTALFI